jgi:hypothetical protein
MSYHGASSAALGFTDESPIASIQETSARVSLALLLQRWVNVPEPAIVALGAGARLLLH